MSAWFGIPVAQDDCERAEVTFGLWRAQGWRTAALIDGDKAPRGADYTVNVARYDGWAASVNALVADVLDWGMQWFATGGADILPIPMTAAEVTKLCEQHFGGTMGVCQPAGDAFGAIANRTACVSPIIGRDFCLRTYGGKGPLFSGYRHFYADGELMHVADRMDCLWWNPAWSHYHDHWSRRNGTRPPHILAAINHTADDWSLFMCRRAADWPGALKGTAHAHNQHR